MEADEWRGSDSYAEWAARFGVAARTIENDASDAGALLKRATTDDEVRHWADAHLTHIRELAQQDGDWTNARGAIKDRLDARGLLVAKHSVAVQNARTPDELFRDMLAEVKVDPRLRAEAIAYLTAEDK